MDTTSTIADHFVHRNLLAPLKPSHVSLAIHSGGCHFVVDVAPYALDGSYRQNQAGVGMMGARTVLIAFLGFLLFRLPCINLEFSRSLIGNR